MSLLGVSGDPRMSPVTHGNQGKPVVQHALVPIFIFVYSTPDLKSFGLKLVLLTKVLQQNKQIVPNTSVD